MEGAAVGQVCTERMIPFAVVRTISDRADHEAPIDFAHFVSTVAAPVGAGIVEELVRRI
jgi:adenosylhomocysteine nucleosidase